MKTGALSTQDQLDLNKVQGSAICFVLPPVMTIETAEAIAAELKQLPLPDKTSLTLDASQVETITSPGLQLIVSLEKTLLAQGGLLIIKGGRDSFINNFKDTGLDNTLSKSSL